MDEEDRILERERLQMEQIRELDFEELQVEEVDEFRDSEEDDDLGISHHTRLRLLSWANLSLYRRHLLRVIL